MAFRGRGRGRGRGGGTSLALPGDDLGAFMKEVREPPALYPEFNRNGEPVTFDAPHDPEGDDMERVKKLQEIRKRCRASPYFTEVKKRNTEIARYTDKYQRSQKLPLSQFLKNQLKAPHFPPELLISTSAGSSSKGPTLKFQKKKADRSKDLEKLENKEATGATGEEDDDDEEHLTDEEEEDPELEGDYGENYFDDGDDGYGDMDDDDNEGPIY